jgi:hypothetical protein
MYNTALKYWRAQSTYRPELARTLFKKAEFLESFGNSEEANEIRKEAEAVYFQIQKSRKTQQRPVPAESFDKAVMIMSR